MAFLPISKQDMKDRGWEQADFVLVTGDAYVDHHSFGTSKAAATGLQYLRSLTTNHARISNASADQDLPIL